MVFLLAAGCSESEETPRVTLPVVVDGSGVETVTTDLGYEVETRSAQIAFSNVEFTVAGEEHTTMIQRLLSSIWIREAHAHPGHVMNGTIAGTLDGMWTVDFAQGRHELGQATLLAGLYQGANFTFGRFEEGHTAHFHLVAQRDDATYDVTVEVTSPEGRQLTGAPFEARVTPDTNSTVEFRFVTVDPIENDTLYDGVDFEALDRDGTGAITISADSEDPAIKDAYNRLLRTFQSHDHFHFQLK